MFNNIFYLKHSHQSHTQMQQLIHCLDFGKATASSELNKDLENHKQIFPKSHPYNKLKSI